MLKQRILTALVLIPPLVLVLFYCSSAAIAALFGLFAAGAAWEWTALAGLKQGWQRILYVTGLVVGGGGGILGVNAAPGLVAPLFVVAVCWWLWALSELVLRGSAHSSLYSSFAGRIASGFFVLIPAWIALYVLHARDSRSPAILLSLLILVWVADSGAFFVGKALGRTRLAPTVSPGKTVEGLVGGVAVVVLLAFICGTMIWRLDAATLAWWMFLAITATLFAAIGDLVESKFKRVAGVKDSGRLLPGHGGILDRIDALTAAAPVFALGWLLLKPST